MEMMIQTMKKAEAVMDDNHVKMVTPVPVMRTSQQTFYDSKQLAVSYRSN